MLDGYVFAVGGKEVQRGHWEDKWIKSLERYDPDTNTWQLTESVNMPDIEPGSAVVALDRFIYAVGM